MFAVVAWCQPLSTSCSTSARPGSTRPTHLLIIPPAPIPPLHLHPQHPLSSQSHAPINPPGQEDLRLPRPGHLAHHGRTIAPRLLLLQTGFIPRRGEGVDVSQGEATGGMVEGVRGGEGDAGNLGGVGTLSARAGGCQLARVSGERERKESSKKENAPPTHPTPSPLRSSLHPPRPPSPPHPIAQPSPPS